MNCEGVAPHHSILCPKPGTPVLTKLGGLLCLKQSKYHNDSTVSSPLIATPTLNTLTCRLKIIYTDNPLTQEAPNNTSKKQTAKY